MRVNLISHTPNALNLLLRTKNTRLANESNPSEWTDAERLDHLRYMLGTIKSSWEFVDYIFHISGVTRALTHQLVRTRTGSFAQESQRTVNVAGRGVVKPLTLHGNHEANGIWDDAVGRMMGAYEALQDIGVPVQDARGLLPTNVTTSIIAKFSLRTLHEMAKVRLCYRTQGEYQLVFREMRRIVLDVHPWAEPFIRVACAADGVCAFPAYRECPIKEGLFAPETGGVYGASGEPREMEVDIGERPKTKDEQQAEWEDIYHEARPVAEKGKTM